MYYFFASLSLNRNLGIQQAKHPQVFLTKATCRFSKRIRLTDVSSASHFSYQECEVTLQLGEDYSLYPSANCFRRSHICIFSSFFVLIFYYSCVLSIDLFLT